VLQGFPGIPRGPVGQTSRHRTRVTGFAAQKTTGNVRASVSVAAGQARRRLGLVRQSVWFPQAHLSLMSHKKLLQAPMMV